MKKLFALILAILTICTCLSVSAESISPKDYTQYSSGQEENVALPRTYSGFFAAFSQFYKWWAKKSFSEPYVKERNANEWVYVNGIRGLTIITEPSDIGALKMVMLEMKKDYKGNIEEESLVGFLSIIAALDYELPDSVVDRSSILREITDIFMPNMYLLPFMNKGDERYFMIAKSDAKYSLYLDEKNDLFFVARFSDE